MISARRHLLSAMLAGGVLFPTHRAVAASGSGSSIAAPRQTSGQTRKWKELSKELSPAAKGLKEALAALTAAPSDRAAQDRYLELFPKTAGAFGALFDPEDFSELYTGSYDYTEALLSLAAARTEDVGRIIVGVGKDAEHKADAPAYLQHGIVKYGINQTSTFARLAKALAAQERRRLFAFLADAENHRFYPEFQTLADGLKGAGERGLSDELELARTRRIKMGPHKER